MSDMIDQHLESHAFVFNYAPKMQQVIIVGDETLLTFFFELHQQLTDICADEMSKRQSRYPLMQISVLRQFDALISASAQMNKSLVNYRVNYLIICFLISK